MIRSMTAFARQEMQETWGQICWELRSVNHRYLDISIRLPEEFRRLEMILRERVQQTLKRGKIEISLYFQADKHFHPQFSVNVVLVEQLSEAMKIVTQLTGCSSPTALDILRWPGVLEVNSLDTEQLNEVILQHFDQGLIQLTAQREREGAQLSTLIEQRCLAIMAYITQIRQELPIVLQMQQERLENRLAELRELNSERIEQEMIILAQKTDVAEELDRIETHVEEVKKTLKENLPIGRRLDFLVQELHREANTLGSKAAHVNTSHHSIEIKVLIEQMREQIQNIE